MHKLNNKSDKIGSVDIKRYILFFLMLIFLLSSSAITYYLIRANFYTNSNLFWIGAIAGFLSCLFLASVDMLISFILRGISTKKNSLIFLMLISFFGVTTIYFYKGPFSLDSDVWWYGAIAGFLSCIALVFLSFAIFIAFKLRHKT